MLKRLLAFFLALAMVLGIMPAAAIPARAAEVTPPFTSITTEDGTPVTYTYKGAISSDYEDGPYYHVTIPEGTEKVLVTYPEDVAILGAPNAYSYTLSVPGYELGYGDETFEVTANDDGTSTVAFTVANYLLTDGTGTAVSLEPEGSFAPITFFSFEYGKGGTEQPEESEEPHTCTFDQKVVSGDFLASAADCTHAASYYYSCTCGQKGTETFTDGDALGHDFQNGSCTRCDEPDPDATIDVTFNVNVADCVITVTDADGEAVEATDGVYKLLPGKTYTYTVQKDGYVTKTDTITLQEAGTVTVTLETVTPTVINSLSALGLYSTYSSATKDIYPMTPAFDPAVKEYTVVAPDSSNACYAKATLAEGVTGTITAAWKNLNNDQAKTATITSGNSSGQILTGAVKTGNYKNTVTFTVAGKDIEDVYTLNILRTPSLTGLSLEGMKLNKTFASTTTAYTASTVAESVTVAATPRDESYTVTVNGGAETTVALEMGENVINVVVKNADGYEAAYTITVTRKEAVTVSFDTNVENPNIVLKDAQKAQVSPVDGVYTLISGETYTYTIQKDGYVGKTGEITPTQNRTVEITLEEATQNPSLPNYSAQWGNFRKGDDNLGITDAPTPYAPEDAELLWAVKYGEGWAAAAGSPIMVDGDIFTYIGSSIKRLDSMTGEVKAEGTMVAKSSFSIVPATYADGMIFVGLAGGKIQAFNAATLESLWVYTDDLGGQPNCPITYKDGYIYAGFWNSETKDAHFACVNTIDEDHDSTTEAKLASWTYTRAGGFYWAGAYVSDRLAIVGTDDGQGGSTSDSSSLLVFDRFTGELLDHRDGIHGDIRSNVSHDPDSDRIFFTSKGGVLCNASVDWDTGKIIDFHQVVLQDANGSQYAMSTCTPSVYNGRIYIGVCGASQFGDNSGHAIAVYDLNGDGSMTRAYAYAIVGYPQTSAMVTTAYADEDDSVYIYLPYNAQPGGVSVLKDKKGQTAPVTTTDEGYSEIFTPVSPLNQYCICSTIADEYTCDAGYYADIPYTDAPVAPAMMTVTVEGPSYTITLPKMDGVETNPLKGYTTTVKEGETFKFYLGTAVGYEPGENYAVKANGQVITGVNGTYTLEKVTSNVTITVEDVKAIHWDPVTVYFSISHDDLFQTGKESGQVMALRKISVPYFDLGLYGLEDFYFSSETYGSDGGEHSSALDPGTPEYAYGKITLLHLYIYALEVYYCGLDESEAGKGYLYDQNLMGTDVLNVSGSTGSFFMNEFWGMDLNLNYYVNHAYPLASAGWGSTADQILLRKGDVITVGHFESWSFFNDSTSIFNYLTPDEENQVYGTTTVTQGEKVTLTGYHAGNGMDGDYTTGHYKITTEPAIYYTGYDDVEQDFEAWTQLGNLSADGTIEIDTTDLTPGTYVVAMAGQYGLEITTDICSTPGGILLVVEKDEEEPDSDVILGDITGDGKITSIDITMVQQALKGNSALTEKQLAAADVNGDGKMTALDVTLMKMYLQNKLDSFPKAQ